MLESEMRDQMEEAGIEDIKIRTDEKGLLGTGEFEGTAGQLRRRLSTDLEFKPLESMSDKTVVRCRPI